MALAVALAITACQFGGAGPQSGHESPRSATQSPAGPNPDVAPTPSSTVTPCVTEVARKSVPELSGIPLCALNHYRFPVPAPR